MSEAKPRRTPASSDAPPPAAWPRAWWVVWATLAAGVMALAVTYPIFDADLWQHLLVGKVIWQTHSIPATQLWSWPTWGQPEVTPSWLFRAALWPFWAAGGVNGLFAWRWLTTLAAFAILWKAAREAGARGPWVLLALVWCALLYRHRSQARPETFVALLLAAQFWVLERRRRLGAEPGMRDVAWWLVPIMLVWANAHISYYLGFVIGAAYLAGAWHERRGGPAQRPMQLCLVLLACAAAAFVNPFGWKLLAQPFQYYFVWRHEPIYQTIDELQPVTFSLTDVDLLPFWIASIVGLAIWRWRARRFDLVQLLLLLVFIPMSLQTGRFVGTMALIVATSYARDLDDFLSRGLPQALNRPLPATFAFLAALAVLVAPGLRDPALAPGYGIRWSFYPVRAADWIESHGVRGHGFNAFGQAGYLVWRFYPDRDRLPFMDIHQSGTKRDRYASAWAFQDERAWQELDARHHFEWAVLPRTDHTTPRLQDFLDADTTNWAMVFTDDAASLFLRRDGALAALAERERYRWIPAGTQRLGALGNAAFADSSVRAEVRAEIARGIAASPYNAHFHAMGANLELGAGDWAAALAHVQAARRQIPWLAGLDQRERIARDSLAAASH
ncbi:MAG: hypothetical protein U0704_17100 [Candidatus Eisenbacteria bacterium]